MESEIELSETWLKESPPELMRFYSSIPGLVSSPKIPGYWETIFGRVPSQYIELQRVIQRKRNRVGAPTESIGAPGSLKQV